MNPRFEGLRPPQAVLIEVRMKRTIQKEELCMKKKILALVMAAAMTLGLTAEEAEAKIIEGFLK